MKNLITYLDKIEDLPNKTGISRDYYGFKYDDYKWRHRGTNIWQYTRRFIEKHIGESFDDVFHEYLIKCKEKLVNEDYYYSPHYVFKDYFDPHYKYRNYNVDENGLIQRNKIERYVKENKSPIIDYRWYLDNNIKPRLIYYIRRKLGTDLYNKIKINGLSEEEYYYIKPLFTWGWFDNPFIKIPIRINNWEELSKSEKKKIKKELRDSKRKQKRELKLVKEFELENLLHIIVKERLEKEKQQNIIDRDRLGFDENSFKRKHGK